MSTVASGGLGRRLATNALHAASGRVVASLVWLVFTPPILREIGAEAFAVWSLFFALTGNFAALDFGIVQGTLRYVAAARERGDHVEGGAFATLGLLAVLVLGAVWFTLVLVFLQPLLTWMRIPPEVVTDAHFALMMSSIVFMLSGFANIMISIAQGYGRFDLANIAVLTVSAQNVIGISIVLYKGWGLRELVINVAIGWALSTIVGFALLSRSAPGFRFRSPRSARARVREAFAFGAPMQITNLMSALNQNIDKFLLSRFVALAALTPYELGFRVAVTAIGFPQLLMLAVMPTAAALHSAADLPRLRALYERGTRWILVATALTGAALIGSADRLYDTWIGPESGDAAWVLWGLTLSCSLAMAAGMASSVARGIARTDLEAWFHVTSGALHVALSFLLLPRIGLTGALIGSIAGNAAGAVVFLSALSSALGWSRASVLIAPNLAPFAAIALGALAGSWVDGRLPDPRMDLLGWLLVGVVAGISATVALAALLATRYVDLREVRAMLAGSPAAVPAPPAP